VHLESLLPKLTEEMAATTVRGFLDVVNAYWTNHCQEMLLIRGIFLYLDRTYALPTVNVKPIWEFGLDLFKEKLIAAKEAVLTKLRLGLLSEILNDRRGEDIDKILLKNLLRMLRALGLYTTQFESYFLEETKQFYRQESERYLTEFPISDVLLHLDSRLEEENQRVIQYLDVTTRKPLVLAIETVALASHVNDILEKGFDELLDKNAIPDLRRLYLLLSRVDALPVVKTFWSSYIKKRGIALITDEEKDKSMVVEILKFKQNLDSILAGPFQNNEDFKYAMKGAFEVFINERQNVPAEMLARFLDTKLKSGKSSKDLNEVELEQLLDSVMQIFKFIIGKDVFEAFYKKDLARRLLLNKCASMDAERSMIQKLKTECGSTFTMQLEGMFKDIAASTDVVESFKESKEFLEWDKTVDAKVFVLTTGFWPPYPAQMCVLPPQLNSFCQVFEQFYRERYNGRRLSWQHNLGQCSVLGIFPKGRKDLEVSLYQALVLNLFNTHASISFNDIKAATNIEEGELKRIMASLSLGSAKVLAKNTESKTIEESDLFSFRADFQHKSRKLKINAVQVRETAADPTKVKESVFKDRQYQVDAAIVRIMKTRKELSHQQLVAELIGQLRFPIKPPDIKKRIESLLEREFLERDSYDGNLYRYLA